MITTIPPAELNPWPSHYAYCLAHPCPVCKAPPGTDCHTTRIRTHKPRARLGAAHKLRDLATTPYETRQLGQRHDTLGNHADPCNRAHWENPAPYDCP